MRFITDLCDVHNPRVLDHLILETEPSPFGDVLRQSLVFDELDGRSRQRLRQAVANDHGRKFRHRLGSRGVPSRLIALRRQHEPVEAIRRQSEQVGQLADRRKHRSGIELDRNAPGKLRQIELDRLRAVRDIGNAKQRVVSVFAQIRQDLAVLRIKQRELAATEGAGGGRAPPACAASS